MTTTHDMPPADCSVVDTEPSGRVMTVRAVRLDGAAHALHALLDADASRPATVYA